MAFRWPRRLRFRGQAAFTAFTAFRSLGLLAFASRASTITLAFAAKTEGVTEFMAFGAFIACMAFGAMGFMSFMASASSSSLRKRMLWLTINRRHALMSSAFARRSHCHCFFSLCHSSLLFSAMAGQKEREYWEQLLLEKKRNQSSVTSIQISEWTW